MSVSIFFAISVIFQLVSGRAVWIPEEFEPEEFSPLAKRADTCGGDASLTPCGGGEFPSNFCCSSATQCLLLNTTTSTTAALCCPAGQDCQNIAPITCDQTLQNATANPNSPLHADPTAPLATCGSACCPMGFSCQSGTCKMQALPSNSAAASTTIALPSATASSSASSSTTSTSSITSLPVPTAAPLEGAPSASGSQSFSGTSFAAGFVPGIFLGALVAAGLVLCTLRREKKKSGAYTNDKHYSSGRDTLTNLGPEVDRRPRVHGRSISEPTVDTDLGHRTEFLNSSPPNNRDHVPQTGYVVQVQANGPKTPEEGQETRTKGWLSRSPFMNYASSPKPTHSPVPNHLKRGTLSFQISPVRALRKQRSMHSLRRQMTDAANRNKRPDLSRIGSTETIKVLMDTPDMRPKMSAGPSASTRNQTKAPPLPQSAKTWETTTSTSSDNDGTTPIEAEPNTYTPTRPGRNSNTNDVGATLQSPYTPSNYPNPRFLDSEPPNMLQIPGNNRDSTWRQTAATTFSGMMEKAGLRKSMLLTGPDPREWNKR